jgi:hypothetical protein
MAELNKHTQQQQLGCSMIDKPPSEDWAALAEMALAAAKEATSEEQRRHLLEQASIYAELAEKARWPRT